MKIHVLTENLQKKLPFVNKAISTRSQLPILLHFLLETKDGKLQISATDLEIGIVIELPVNIEEEGAVTIPAKTFCELIASLPQGKITLETKENALEVITPKTKSTFQMLPKEDFPKLYEEKGLKIATFKKTALHKDFSKVLFSASTDMGRPALSGIYLKKEEDSFLIVATDGYRLSLKRQQGSKKENAREDWEEKPLLVPSRVLKELLGVKEQEEEVSFYISQKNNQILFEQTDMVLVGRLIEAQFPPYEKIIPSDYSTKVFFDREELYKAVKICAIFAREAANIVRFEIEKDKIIVSANGSASGKNTVDVEAKVVGEGGEIAFNVRYLLDLFANVEENNMVFEMTGSLNPGVFKIKDDASFLHLIMPIKVQE